MKKATRIIFLLGVLSFIFFMSSQNGIESNNYNEEIVNLLRIKGGIDLYSIFDPNSVVIIIRKLGHFLEFTLLSIASYLVFTVFKIRRATVSTCLFCISLAAVDELHQLFVLGRTSSVIDVIIDSLGVMITVCVISLVRIIKYELMNQDESYSLKKQRNL
jgi:VanZ family protein